MADATAGNAATLFEYLNSIGTIGLAFIVWGLLKGWLITKREHDREIARGDKLELRLDKALNYGGRAIEAGKTIVERTPEV